MPWTTRLAVMTFFVFASLDMACGVASPGTLAIQERLCEAQGLLAQNIAQIRDRGHPLAALLEEERARPLHDALDERTSLQYRALLVRAYQLAGVTPAMVRQIVARECLREAYAKEQWEMGR